MHICSKSVWLVAGSTCATIQSSQRTCVCICRSLSTPHVRTSGCLHQLPQTLFGHTPRLPTPACRRARQQLHVLQAWHCRAQHKRQLKVKGLHAWYLYCLNVLSKALRGWHQAAQRSRRLAALLERARQQRRRAMLQRMLAAWQDCSERRHLQHVLQDSALQQRRRRRQQEVLLAWRVLGMRQVGSGRSERRCTAQSVHGSGTVCAHLCLQDDSVP